MADARKAAAAALVEVETRGAYSNLTLQKLFSGGGFSAEDRALTSALFYGVLDRRITLDFVLSRLIKKGIESVRPYTAAVLRLSAYQLMYMERIPPSAAVNEAVRLVKGSRERYNAAFVNAVLRSLLRGGVCLPQGDDIPSLSVRCSCPEWIVESFASDYGLPDAKALLEESLKAPPVTLRVNTLRITPQALAERLSREGIETKLLDADAALEVCGGIDIAASGCYREGLFFVQDLASQRSIARLSPRPGERLLDLCAAPGGKSFTAAIHMENSGRIEAFDLNERRAELIAAGAERLGLSCIRASSADATRFHAQLGVFDAVLCDVPCSGLGVLRRKPEIKYKADTDFSGLEAVQRTILDNAARYTAPGGRLLYSTCTLRRAENELQIKAFLDRSGGFALQYEHTYMPHTDGTDGFYCALLVKKR